MVLHLEVDRAPSFHWRLEERSSLHHSAVCCGLSVSDCVVTMTSEQKNPVMREVNKVIAIV